ncbi:hypothetical protein WP8S18C01_12740 [Aeromonas caviae]|nr:hypothetical protein ACGSH8M1_012950 [Aeromonas caviae]BBT52311.1 hypothetical protein WP8S18C01_12740 [Aeromonas caviae]
MAKSKVQFQKGYSLFDFFKGKCEQVSHEQKMKILVI